MLSRLNEAYDLRNRIVHRYIISPIKTYDMIPFINKLLELHDEIRLILRNLENQQVGKNFGIYGRGFEQVETFDEVEVLRANSWANDKHVINRFRNKIGNDKP